MELITTFRFRANNHFVGIVGIKDPQIRYTLFEQHAVHHFEEDFIWVCAMLDLHGVSYTYEKFTHFYSPQKNDR